MTLLKRLGLVGLVALLTGIPGGCATQSEILAPVWYKVLATVAAGAGVGIGAAIVGVLSLIALRERENGGLRVALIATAVSGLFLSFAVFYPSLREN